MSTANRDAPLAMRLAPRAPHRTSILQRRQRHSSISNPTLSLQTRYTSFIMAKTELDLNKMIQDGRERKKNETLANRIFGRDRRQSAPSAFKGPAAGSLASRIKPKNVRPHPLFNAHNANQYSHRHPPSAPPAPASPPPATSTASGHTTCTTPAAQSPEAARSLPASRSPAALAPL